MDRLGQPVSANKAEKRGLWTSEVSGNLLMWTPEHRIRVVFQKCAKSLSTLDIDSRLKNPVFRFSLVMFHASIYIVLYVYIEPEP